MARCIFLRRENDSFYCDADKDSRRIVGDANYVDKYCRDKKEHKKCGMYKELMSDEGNEDGGGCYITTACVMAKGLPDDCYELTCLRKFRDEYLLKTANGATAVKNYYETAPKILRSINEREDSTIIYNTLYEDLIIKCIDFIENNKNDEAFKHYEKIVGELQNKYLK